MSKLWVVGVTGRSGSGKSSLAQYYASMGYPMEDGDALSRFVCTPGSPCVQELKAAFGPGIVDSEGGLLRGKLGAMAYEKPALNQKLISIVHPYILKELEKREKIAENAGAKLFFLDGAMIIGSIFETHCDSIILVESAPKLSISRIILRDGISKAAAHMRLDAQKSEEELRMAADFVIENNGSQQSLQQKARQVLQQILEKAEADN